MGDMDYVKGVDTGHYQGASAVTNAAGVISQKRSRTINVFVAADAAANTNLAEQVIAQFPNWSGGAKVTDARVTVVTNVAIAGTTNYAVIKVQSRDDAQGSALTVGILNFAVTAATAFVGAGLTLTKNQLTLAALSKLTLRHDKTGANPIQLPAYTLMLVVEDT